MIDLDALQSVNAGPTLLCSATKTATARRILDAFDAAMPPERILFHAGVKRFQEGDLQDAITHFRRLTELYPHNDHHRTALGDCLLRSGEFAEAWRAYFLDWGQCPQLSQVVGQTLVINAHDDSSSSMGLGDTIQFARFIPKLKALGVARIVLRCNPKLRSLMASVPGIDGFCEETDATQVRLFVATALVAPSPSSLATNVPYLHADPVRVDRWRERLGSEHRKRIGIIWQSAHEKARCAPLQAFAPLARLPGVALYSLQAGGDTKAADFPITDLAADFEPNSLADDAAVMMNMDLVVSVDTGPAHLAGALGVPVWIALRNTPTPGWLNGWRWLQEGNRTPWYPSARLFNRDAREWQSVFEDMAMVLSAPEGDLAQRVRQELHGPGFALVQSARFFTPPMPPRLAKSTYLEAGGQGWRDYPELATYARSLEGLLRQALPDESVRLASLLLRHHPAAERDPSVEKMHDDGGYIRSIAAIYGESTIYGPEEKSVPAGHTLFMTGGTRANRLGLRPTLHRRPGAGPERLVIVCDFVREQ